MSKIEVVRAAALRCALVLLGFTASACGQAPWVTVPVPAVQALASDSIVMEDLEQQLFSKISEDPGRDITFSQEYQFGPELTLFSVNGTAIENLEATLNDVAPDAIPPLENDIAMCKKVPTASGYVPVPTASSYPMVPLVAEFDRALPDGGSVFMNFGEMARFSGRLTQVSIVPDDAGVGQLQTFADGTSGVTSFRMTAQVRDLQLFLFQSPTTPLFNTVEGVNVTCAGRIRPAAPPPNYTGGGCGDVNLHCEAPVVDVFGVVTSLPFPIFMGPLGNQAVEFVAEGIIRGILERGINLHFNNFAALGLVFTGTSPNTKLSLRGASSVLPDGTSRCSDVATPEPPLAPTRTLARLHTDQGSGYAVSNLGNVMPFQLIPEVEVKVDTTMNDLTIHELEPVPPPSNGVYTNLGAQGPHLYARNRDYPGIAFNPEGFKTRVRLKKHVAKNCWLEPVGQDKLNELFIESNTIVKSAKGKGLAMGSPPELFAAELIIMEEVVPVKFEEEVAPLLEQLEMDPSNFGSRPWTRMTLTAAPAPRPRDEPFPRGGGDRPWEVVIWLDREHFEVRERFWPTLECGEAQPYQVQVSETRKTNPGVTYYPFMVDSMDVPSGTLVETTPNTGSLRTFSSGLGSAAHLVLGSQCQVSASPCWTGELQLQIVPAYVEAVGHSGTTMPRFPVRAITASGFGLRNAAVHGVLDRSALAAYTSTPSVYRDIGLTTNLQDYRGRITLDWAHDTSGFPAPGRVDAWGRTTHVTSSRPNWAVAGAGFEDKFASFAPYFADWQKDDVAFRRHTLDAQSYCVLPEDQVAVPLRVKVRGGGLQAERIFPVQDLFPFPPNAAGEFVLGENNSAGFDGARLLNP